MEGPRALHYHVLCNPITISTILNAPAETGMAIVIDQRKECSLILVLNGRESISNTCDKITESHGIGPLWLYFQHYHKQLHQYVYGYACIFFQRDVH